METAGIQSKRPLHLAADHGHVAIVRMLLENGAMKEVVDADGDTPLISAAWKGHHEVVRMLLDNGAMIEASVFGLTPLIFAACEGHVEVVRILLEKGARKHGVIPKIKWEEKVSRNERIEILKLLSDE